MLRDSTGAPVHVAWGRDVLPGDLLAIDYVDAAAELPRAWDHIGALAGDSTSAPDGALDGADRLWHMTPRGLAETSLAGEAPIRVRIFRFRDQLSRSAARARRAYGPSGSSSM